MKNQTGDIVDNSNAETIGVNRSHGRSMVQKWTFAGGHLAILLICAWLIYGKGWEGMGHVIGKSWVLSDFFRAQILLVCAVLYWLRHVITLFYLLVRKVEWSEVLGLLIFIGAFEIGLVLIGGGGFRDYAIGFNSLDLVALTLFFSRVLFKYIFRDSKKIMEVATC